MPMNIDWTAIAAIPVLVFILFVVIYLWSRGVRRGKPLLPIQKSMITYACLFSLGMGYAIAFKSQLAALFGWRNAWIAVIVLLALILAAFAWWRHRLTVTE